VLYYYGTSSVSLQQYKSREHDVCMFDSFETLFGTVWNSLDDVLICIAVFFLCQSVGRFLYWCVAHYFGQSKYAAELSSTLWMMSTIVYLASHLAGKESAVSLFSGFLIGVGYAMRPYITSFVTSAMLKSSDILKAGDTVQINGTDYVIDHIGLLYVCARNGAYMTYLPVDRMGSNPFSVKKCR